MTAACATHVNAFEFRDVFSFLVLNRINLNGDFFHENIASNVASPMKVRE